MKYYCSLFLALILVFFNCTPRKSDLNERLASYLSSLNVKGNRILLISLDDCLTCNVLFQENCIKFVEEGGQVVILSGSRKKANLFLELNHSNVYHDQFHEAKNKLLHKSMPVMYVIDGASIDSIHVFEPEQLLYGIYK